MARLFELFRFTAILGVLLHLLAAVVVVNYVLEQISHSSVISPVYYFLPVPCYVIGAAFLVGGMCGMWILHRKNLGTLSTAFILGSVVASLFFVFTGVLAYVSIY